MISFRKIPTTAVPITFFDVLKGFKSILGNNTCIEEFENAFAEYIGTKYAFLVNSGTTAFYIMLRTYRRFSDRTEVVLPAYTVPTLTLPIWKAGLKPVLCDVSRETFNMDPDSLAQVVSDRTLCVVPVHMFGFPCALDPIFEVVRGKDIFVFEDAAQAPGAVLNGKMVGAIAEAAIFSLCKGKNFSTYTGGIITASSERLVETIKKERDFLEERSLAFKLTIPFIMFAFTYAMRPVVYNLFYKIIEPFKSTQPHTGFTPLKYTQFQAAVGCSLLKKLPQFNKKRYENGMMLYKTLKDNDRVIVPEIIPGAVPVFNHFPVVLKEKAMLDVVQKELWERGIDTARMYQHPIHHIYDLGYSREKDPFPNATYIAERLMTLPTHPFMQREDLEKIVDVFRRLR